MSSHAGKHRVKLQLEGLPTGGEKSVRHKKVATATETDFATEITENGNGGSFVTATANGENTEDGNGLNCG